MFTNEDEAYAESEAYDSASVVATHTAYNSAFVVSVASVN